MSSSRCIEGPLNLIYNDNEFFSPVFTPTKVSLKESENTCSSIKPQLEERNVARQLYMDDSPMIGTGRNDTNPEQISQPFPHGTYRVLIRRPDHFIPWGLRLEIYNKEDKAKLYHSTFHTNQSEISQIDGVENIIDGDEVVGMKVIYENKSFTTYKGKVSDRSWSDLTLRVLDSSVEVELYLVRYEDSSFNSIY